MLESRMSRSGAESRPPLLTSRPNVAFWTERRRTDIPPSLDARSKIRVVVQLVDFLSQAIRVFFFLDVTIQNRLSWSTAVFSIMWKHDRRGQPGLIDTRNEEQRNLNVTSRQFYLKNATHLHSGLISPSTETPPPV
jgi:hypothetical protein